MRQQAADIIARLQAHGIAIAAGEEVGKRRHRTIDRRVVTESQISHKQLP
jgi:hypothetical protein